MHKGNNTLRQPDEARSFISVLNISYLAKVGAVFIVYFITAKLGLNMDFIVKEIIKGHHGDIYLDSETGKGTKFTVELPTDG